MVNGSFPGIESGRGVTLTTHLFLVLSLRAFMACKKGETYLHVHLVPPDDGPKTYRHGYSISEDK
jgi:hypothetical protein